MADATKISWCDSTFNPWIGCQHVSPGCDNCYAETQNARRKWAADGQWGPHTERHRTSDVYWRGPVTWNNAAAKFTAAHGRKRRVFAASLADWLDNAVPHAWRSDFCALVERTPRLNWLLLTKRPENYKKLVPANWSDGPPDNVWIGFTAEDREHYLQRWPHVAEIDAKVRFLSYEPAIGPLGELGADHPDWIIMGGESGSNARPMQADWVAHTKTECRLAGIPFFFKQWGAWGRSPKDKGGNLINGAAYEEFPDA